MTDTLDCLKTALSDRYTIGREIGRGGMAIVFLAEEHRPSRRVAIKVLDPAIANQLLRKRFIREVDLTSKLIHPHIVPVFAAGEADDLLYYVMPYVDGESVLHRIQREGVFSLPLALKIAREVASALHYAHDKGIIHRDIKSANILLTGDDAFVADFGIARAIDVAAEDMNITQTGLPIGTPAYWSPEQASGEGNLDRQTDVYGLGCVLYEMLVGAPPSTEPGAKPGIATHPSDYPVPNLSAARDGVPDALDVTVGRSLAKAVSDRFATAAQFEQALAEVEVTVHTAAGRRRTRNRFLLGFSVTVLFAVAAVVALLRSDGWGPARVVERPMLVVLPFENLGPPEDRYFADGITDAVTARLASLVDLGVISRTSAIQYLGTEKTIGQIGDELNVDFVLQGTVQRENPTDPTSSVRIIPQLIRVSDDTHVWTGTFDEDMADVFRVQSQIAERVAQGLDLTLLEPDRFLLNERPTDNLLAYDYYMRGRDYLWQQGSSTRDAIPLRIAVDMFERAIELDSVFALAYTDLSNAHWALFTGFVDRSEERLERWRGALEKALELQPDLPEAHLALGLYDYSTNASPDYANVLEEFEFVVEHRPNNTLVLEFIGVVQAALGKWDEALGNAARAADLDPLSPDRAGFAGWLHLLARRYTEAEIFLDRAISLAPDLPDPYSNKASLYLGWTGDTAKAHNVMRGMIPTVSPGAAALALVQSARTLVATGASDSLFDLLSPTSFAGPFPFNYFFVKAEFYRLRGQQVRSRAYSDSLLAALLDVYEEQASDPNLSWYVGYAYAGLGRRAEAIRHADLVVSLLSASENALRTAFIQPNVIWIYALAGEYDAAIDQMEYLLSVPSGISAQYLRVEAYPASLREHPRFQALLERYGN
jgi:TolB-like protein/Tfp pilus assembly protein PilF